MGERDSDFHDVLILGKLLISKVSGNAELAISAESLYAYCTRKIWRCLESGAKFVSGEQIPC
jgi:hypothetical protein